MTRQVHKSNHITVGESPPLPVFLNSFQRTDCPARALKCVKNVVSLGGCKSAIRGRPGAGRSPAMRTENGAVPQDRPAGHPIGGISRTHAN